MASTSLQMQCSAAAGSQALGRPARRVGTPTAPALRRGFAGQRLRQAVSNGAKCTAFFKFKKKDEAPSPYHEFHTPEHRDDYTAEEVKEYFNYMGMLAEDGTYDRLDTMLASGKHPADLLLLMAAYENDEGKVEELLEAGANVNITDEEGKTPMDLTTKDEVRELLQAKLAQLAAN